MTNAQKADLVYRFVDAMNTQDFGALSCVVAEDYIQHNPFVPPGRAGLCAFFEGSLTAFEDGVGRVLDILVDGNRIAARLEFRGIHRGTFLGIEGTGKYIVFETADFFRVENNLLKEHWDVSDWAGVFHQMGILPPIGPYANF